MTDDTDDVEGLIRVLSTSDFSDLEAVARDILDSEWLSEHEFSVVRSFLAGCLQGLGGIA